MIVSISRIPNIRISISTGVIFTFRIEGLLNIKDTRWTFTNNIENINVKHILNTHGLAAQLSIVFSPKKANCEIGIVTDASANKTKNAGCAARHTTFFLPAITKRPARNGNAAENNSI